MQQKETNLGAISILITASDKRLESAGNMAKLRCKEYDADNIHWKKVDALEREHSLLVDKLTAQTEMMLETAVAADGTSGGLDDIVNPKKTTIEKESNKNGKRTSDVSNQNVVHLGSDASDSDSVSEFISQHLKK